MELVADIFAAITVLAALGALWLARTTLGEARATRAEEREWEACNRELNRLYQADGRLAELAQSIEKAGAAISTFPINQRWYNVAAAIAGVRVSLAALSGHAMPACLALANLHPETASGPTMVNYSALGVASEAARREVGQTREQLALQIRDAQLAAPGADKKS
jgi:hypothetical protein